MQTHKLSTKELRAINAWSVSFSFLIAPPKKKTNYFEITFDPRVKIAYRYDEEKNKVETRLNMTAFSEEASIKGH